MEEPFRQPPNASKVIDVGSIVVIHSLTSVRGAELNGKRAIVIARRKDRWETKVEGKQNVAIKYKTTALKPDNLSISKKSVGMHPNYWTLVAWATDAWTTKELHNRPSNQQTTSLPYRNARGLVYDDTPPPARARKFVELLDRPDEGYEPNQTLLMGEAGMYYNLVPESSMNMDCTIYDLEHVAGLISLMAMCQGEIMKAVGCGDGECEAVLFALLEAAPTSITVLLEFLIWTPYIGPENNYSKVEDAFCTARVARTLTPNQQSEDYYSAMKGGTCLIFLLLREAGPSKTVFVRVMIKHTLFPLLVQRLLRIVAREAMGTPEGKVLGLFARNILAEIAYVDLNFTEINNFSKCYWAMCENNVFSKTAIPAMLREDSVTSAESLRDRLEDWIDGPAVARFCDE